MQDIESIYRIFLECGMNISTDTRKIEPGCMFFSLKGENFNGNLFAEKALDSGAKYAVVDEKTADNERLILVEDALKALQNLASYHRDKMNAKVIGIGGSNGKTTTKELMLSVMSVRYATHCTQGNLNNHIGVPLTLLKLREEHEISIIELGTNRIGDVKELCEIAKPDFGLITNIGKEHLEGFGSIEGVARAESELFDFLLANNGHAFVNMDDVWLSAMSTRLINKTEYGMSFFSDKKPSVIPEIEFEFRGLKIHSVLPGIHNLQNIMAVLSVAEYFRMEANEIKQGIERYKPSNNRSQIINTERGNVVILDAYNANPSSVEMALKTISGMEGKKFILLGDMFELGDHEASEHQNISDLCSEIDDVNIVLVGNAFAKTRGNDDVIHRFNSKEDARNYIQQLKVAGCTVLIKGSRGMKMEDLLNEF